MKNILKTCLALVLLVGFSSLTAQTTRSLSYFNKLSASSSVKVKLIKSNEHKVAFKMTTGSEERLITEVKNDRLIVKIKNKSFGWNGNAKAAVKVYYTELNEVDVNAGASVKAEEVIHTANMDVSVSSGARADLEVESDKIYAEVSSGGRIELEGTAKNGKYEASSGGFINAVGMVCDNVDAEASSGGQLKVYANKKLDAEASSGGTIRYKGNAEYTNTDSGWSGKIKRIN